MSSPAVRIRNNPRAIIPLMEKPKEPGTYPGGPRQTQETTAILWENVRAIMRHYNNGEENLNWLARETGVGVGTIARIKEQGTSIGLQSLDKIAKRFGLWAGDLLLPSLDPANPPVAQISDKQRAEYEEALRLKKAVDAARGTK